MKLEIQKNISLAQYTTLHVGGVADYVVEVGTVEELGAAAPTSSSQTSATAAWLSSTASKADSMK